MSISNFISAGVIFHNYRKRDVSLALICSALDATAKKVFPDDNNNQRNKKFMKKYMRIITNFGFPGISATEIRIKCINVSHIKTDNKGYVGIEDIIYHTIRCGLVHECEIENMIEFTDETLIGDLNGKFKVPKQLFWGLALSTILCEQNKDEKSEDAISINICGKDFSINDLWGKENDFLQMLSQ